MTHLGPKARARLNLARQRGQQLPADDDEEGGTIMGRHLRRPTWQEVKPKPRAQGAGIGGAIGLVILFILRFFVEVDALTAGAIIEVAAFAGAWLPSGP